MMPDDVDIFSLTNDDLDFYYINTKDYNYIVKLYELNLVITVVNDGIKISLYNQNNFYYLLVSRE